MAHGDLTGVSGGGGAAGAGAAVGADVAGRRYGLAPRSQITPVWARCCWAMMLAGVDPGPSRCDGLGGAGRVVGVVARMGSRGAAGGLLAAGAMVFRAIGWRDSGGVRSLALLAFFHSRQGRPRHPSRYPVGLPQSWPPSNMHRDVTSLSGFPSW